MGEGEGWRGKMVVGGCGVGRRVGEEGWGIIRGWGKEEEVW